MANLLESLSEQSLVSGNADIAEAFAGDGELVAYSAGQTIIEQGASGNQVFLILAGSCDVFVHERHIATRNAGTHIGEMCVIQPSQPRSATVVAMADGCVLLSLDEAEFTNTANRFPEIWKRIAKELARRLIQRNRLVPTTHDRIRVFIMSSAESLPVARAIQNALEYDPFHVVVWTDGVFKAASYPLESLEGEVDAADFALAIAAPDDVTEVRGESWPSPRDNVVFELGFFMGRLGRSRALLVEPRGDKVKLPSDLAGLTTLSYRWSGKPDELASAVAPACNRLREIIQDLGPNN